MQQAGIFQCAFHEPCLKGWLQQLLLSVLAGVDQQLFPQGAHAFLGAQGIIYIQTAAAAFGQQAAPDDHLPSVHLELCFDLGLFRSLPYHIGAQPVAQQKAQGFEDKAFACPCFAGEHVHARGKVEFGIFDESEIADTQIFQHGQDLFFETGIKEVTQAFTQKVVAQHGHQDGDTRIKGKPGGIFQNGLALHEHVPPAGRGRLDAKSEKTEPGFHQDGAGHAQRGGNEHRGQCVGQDMAQQYPAGGTAGQTRRRNKIPLTQAQGLGPDQTGDPHPGCQADDDHDVGQARLQKGDD